MCLDLRFETQNVIGDHDGLAAVDSGSSRYYSGIEKKLHQRNNVKQNQP